MNKEVGLKWAERLESGIEQCTGSLSKGECRCCLGVLVEIAAEEGVCEIFRLPGGDLHSGPEELRRKYSALVSDAIVDWAGLTRKQVVFANTTDNVSFARMNDRLRMTFPEIAAHIRKLIDKEAA